MPRTVLSWLHLNSFKQPSMMDTTSVTLAGSLTIQSGWFCYVMINHSIPPLDTLSATEMEKTPDLDVDRQYFTLRKLY